MARVWDETIDATPGSARPRALLGPVLVLFALATLTFMAVWSGVARIPSDVLAALDVTTRGLAARSPGASGVPPDAWRPLLLSRVFEFHHRCRISRSATKKRYAALSLEPEPLVRQ